MTWPDADGWWALIRAGLHDDPEEAAMARREARRRIGILTRGDAEWIAQHGPGYPDLHRLPRPGRDTPA